MGTRSPGCTLAPPISITTCSSPGRSVAVLVGVVLLVGLTVSVPVAVGVGIVGVYVTVLVGFGVYGGSLQPLPAQLTASANGRLPTEMSPTGASSARSSTVALSPAKLAT